MELPVYMITGFLESGKTSFILDTISDKQFSKGQRTLIIACEEGEVEYAPDILKAAKAEVWSGCSVRLPLLLPPFNVRMTVFRAQFNALSVFRAIKKQPFPFWK